MKKLIIANWKMLPESLGQAEEILVRMEEGMRELDLEMFSVAVCPPFVFLEDIARRLGDGVLAEAAVLGAQDIAARDDAAQTGEVSGPQLAKLGARYVIVGHSERRYKLGETDDLVNEKLKAALRNGLVPIVCVGERERTGAWQDELALQIAGTFRGLTPGQVGQCFIAYEPVWAISTNLDAKPDTPASSVQSMNLIREALADQFNVSHHAFLYGGSVTPANAADFLLRPEIVGIIVGGASVRVDDFCAILSVASQPRP